MTERPNLLDELSSSAALDRLCWEIATIGESEYPADEDVQECTSDDSDLFFTAWIEGNHVGMYTTAVDLFDVLETLGIDPVDRVDSLIEREDALSEIDWEWYHGDGELDSLGSDPGEWREVNSSAEDLSLEDVESALGSISEQMESKEL